ncbi:MAG: hypothetical protein AAF533_26155 [Acidobacteriota bacterium]
MPRWLAVVFTLVMTATGPATAQPDRQLAVTRSGPLVFHHPEHLQPQVDDLLERQGDELETLARLQGLPLPEHAEVYVLPRRLGFHPEQLGLPPVPGWAAGAAYHDQPVIVLRVVEGRTGQGHVLSTLYSHELVHLLQSQAFGERMHELPSWWKEGTASHYASEIRLDGSGSWRSGGGYIPLLHLRDSFPRDELLAQRAYVQSFAFIRWLCNRAGDDAPARLHRKMLVGTSFAQAFREVFGTSPYKLEPEFRQQHQRRNQWLPFWTSESLAWGLASLVFVLGWWRKRRISARRLEEMAEEERLEDEAAAARAAAEAAAAEHELGVDTDPETRS